MVIPDISCKGFTLNIKELTIGQAIDVAMLPKEGCHEKNLSIFLGFCFGGVVGGISSNPKLWTCSQRYLALVMYMAYVFDEGFGLKVGDNSTLLDYANINRQLVAFTELNDNILESITIANDVHGGDTYHFVQLLGWHVEAIETVAENYTDWLLCVMAACIRVDGKDSDYPYNENTSTYDYAQFLIERVNTFKKFPESMFIELTLFFSDCFRRYSSFFDLWFDSKGVVAMHNKEGIDNLSYESLRFRVSDAIRRETKRISGGND